MRTLLTAVLLGLVWLVWSWHFEPLVIGFGAVAIVATTAIVHRLSGIDFEGMPIELGPRLFAYLPFLAWEMLKANIQTARLILDPKLPVRPHLIRVRANQRTSLGEVIFANSITITPGTVTLDVRDGILLVHCLDDAMASEDTSGALADRVRWLESGLRVPDSVEPSLGESMRPPSVDPEGDRQ
ncbi:MAG: Na+/H+ antiporter subunit E [Sandaracinaceae bacterium]